MKIRETLVQGKNHEWIELIKERDASGMTIKVWFELKGLSKHQYYYWLRKIRQKSCTVIEERTTDNILKMQEERDAQFAEINEGTGNTETFSGISIRLNNEDIYWKGCVSGTSYNSNAGNRAY